MTDQPPLWLVSIVDRLRNDYKDGNWQRSEEAARDFLSEFPGLLENVQLQELLIVLRAALRVATVEVGRLRAERCAQFAVIGIGHSVRRVWGPFADVEAARLFVQNAERNAALIDFQINLLEQPEAAR